jgi:hypothetical protein
MEVTFQMILDAMKRKRANGELSADSIEGAYYTKLDADGKVIKIYHKRRKDD